MGHSRPVTGLIYLYISNWPHSFTNGYLPVFFEEITYVETIQILTLKSYYEAFEVRLVPTYTRQVVLTVFEIVFF